jgi:hypothetical protein
VTSPHGATTDSRQHKPVAFVAGQIPETERRIMTTETEIVYRTKQTTSGWAVVRRNGDYAEFLSEDDAVDAVKLLEAGKECEASFYWTKSE